MASKPSIVSSVYDPTADPWGALLEISRIEEALQAIDGFRNPFPPLPDDVDNARRLHSYMKRPQVPNAPRKAPRPVGVVVARWNQ